MRLEEWQKFIESQFLEDGGATEPEKEPDAENALEAAAEIKRAETPANEKRSGDSEKSEARLETQAENTDAPTAQTTFPYVPVTVKPTADALSHEAKPLFAAINVEEVHALALPLAEEAPLIPGAAMEAGSESLFTPPAEEGREASAPAYRQTLDFDTEIPEFASYMPSHRAKTSDSADAPAPSSAPSSKPTDETAPEITRDLMASRPVAVHENRLPAALDDSENDPLFRGARKPQTRARHARNARPENVSSGLAAAPMWADVPRHVQTLIALERIEEKEIAQSSYKRPFAEGRLELIERLLDPILSLEDTARLLNVCPTTVRRYTNRGILTHYRKETERGGDASRPTERETRQRRFRLSDILAFLETQQAALAADRKLETLPR